MATEWSNSLSVEPVQLRHLAGRGRGRGVRLAGVLGREQAGPCGYIRLLLCEKRIDSALAYES